MLYYFINKQIIILLINKNINKNIYIIIYNNNKYNFNNNNIYNYYDGDAFLLPPLSSSSAV